MAHEIRFRASGRGKAQCPPNPEYQNGIALNASRPDAPNCMVKLPYPAPECGLWIVSCDHCDMTVAVTAAGRTDDPISLAMECKAQEIDRTCHVGNVLEP